MSPLHHWFRHPFHLGGDCSTSQRGNGYRQRQRYDSIDPDCAVAAVAGTAAVAVVAAAVAVVVAEDVEAEKGADDREGDE